MADVPSGERVRQQFSNFLEVRRADHRLRL